MKYPHPKVGDDVFLVEHYYRGESRMQYTQVTAVGRKYFSIARHNREVKFHLDSWREKTEYNSMLSLYPCEAVYHEEKELQALRGKVQRFFSQRASVEALTSEQLKKIEAIVCSA